MPTLIDVASEANVSTASVSRFLKNPDSVSLKIAQRIKAAIEKLDYRLDSSAQSLKTGKYYRVRIISPATGPFYWEIISSIADALSVSGYFIDIIFTRDPKYKKHNFHHLYKTKNVDGTISIPLTTKEDDEFIAHLKKIEEKFVIIDRFIDDADISQVTIDNSDIGETAARTLVDYGHKKLLFIDGSRDVMSSRERRNGFLNELKKHDIELEEERIIPGDFNPEKTYGYASQFFLTLPEYTAVFASNDLTALAFAKAAYEQGLKIPEDFSLIGVDDADYIPYCYPFLSTFRQPLQIMGSIAVKLLLSQIEGYSLREKRVQLKAQFIKRKSLSRI